MAGSIRWFNYTTDGGVTYSIQADRSNIAAVNPSGTGTPSSLVVGAVPRNITPRYALFADISGTIRRKVPLLTPADVVAVTATLSFVPQGETATVTLTYLVGERIRLPKLQDTGRTT